VQAVGDRRSAWIGARFTVAISMSVAIPAGGPPICKAWRGGSRRERLKPGFQPRRSPPRSWRPTSCQLQKSQAQGLESGVVARRTYNQYCAAARALDVVGERWTLLIVRELLTGPKRYRDLIENLSGIGTGLLAARLRFLEQEGLVERTVLPPPARTPAYDLTEAGADLRPAIMALSHWGMRWALDERRDGEEFRPGWGVLGMHAIFDKEAARGASAVYEFRIDGDVFHARIDDGAIESVHGPAQHPDVAIEAPGDLFLEMAMGSLDPDRAMRDKSVSISGDRQTLRRMGQFFRWPRPKTRGATTR
jgi:DNA-binding HxlR family transcriptional regulator